MATRPKKANPPDPVPPQASAVERQWWDWDVDGNEVVGVTRAGVRRVCRGVRRRRWVTLVRALGSPLVDLAGIKAQSCTRIVVPERGVCFPRAGRGS
jgi:hypothetical protein